jgi:hypothetical protein
MTLTVLIKIVLYNPTPLLSHRVDFGIQHVMQLRDGFTEIIAMMMERPCD